MARTLFALLLTGGIAAAQDPQPTPTPDSQAPASNQPAPVTNTPTTQPPAATQPYSTTPASQSGQPMATTPGVVQGGYTAPMTTYPYQPGQIMQSGYSQPGMAYGSPMVYGSGMASGYSYPGTLCSTGNYPGYAGYGYPSTGYSTWGGYPSGGYAYPSFANGYANSNYYGTAGGGRRLFRR